MFKQFIQSLLFFCLGFNTISSQALTFSLPDTTDVIGHIYEVHSHLGETLSDVGRRYEIGAFQIFSANPHLNRKHALT